MLLHEYGVTWRWSDSFIPIDDLEKFSVSSADDR